MGFPDRLLLENEPGHRTEKPPQDDHLPALGDKGLRALHHSLRGAKIVRASFAIDGDGRVTELPR